MTVEDATCALVPLDDSVPHVSIGLLTPVLGGGTPASQPDNWNGDVPFVTPPDLNGLDGQAVTSWTRTVTETGAVRGSTRMNAGVLISCRAPIGHVGTVESVASFNQGCKGLPVQDRVDAKYLAYCLVAGREALIALGNGTTFAELSARALGSFKVPWHSWRVRQQVVDYLDHETAEIDAMDAELDRLVETLRERRLAVVEKTLLPGFERAGVQPLWSLLRPTKDQGHAGEQVLSVYRDYGVIPKGSRDDNHNRTPADLSNYQLVQPGAVVINKMKAWQGSLGVSGHRGIVSPDYQVCRPLGNEVDSRYLHLVLRSPQMIPQYGVRSKGIRPSQWRLYWEDMATLTVPVPPLDEQRRIVDELDQQTAQIDDMIADANRLKGLLAERRSTLITNVVTGKKEVPT